MCCISIHAYNARTHVRLEGDRGTIPDTIEVLWRRAAAGDRLLHLSTTREPCPARPSNSYLYLRILLPPGGITGGRLRARGPPG